MAVNTSAILYNIATTVIPLVNVSDDVTDMMNGTVNGSVETTPVPSGPVNLPDHFKVRNLIYNYLGPAICLIGMVCNVINVLVLTHQQLPESPYTYLTGLACTDFTALFLSFVFMVFSKDATTYEWRVFESYIFIGFVNICTNSSVWITVLLTIERFLFVRHPLWAKDTCNRASAKVKIFITISLIALINIPRFLIHRPLESGDKWVLTSTKFRISDAFFVINWAYSILIHFVPLIILSLANFYLVYAVRNAGRQREKLNIRNNREEAWQKEQRRLTITLISIVFLFIVCIIPSAFSDRPIAYKLFGGGKTEKEFVSSSFYYNLQYIANFLVWCELSLNFVLYCAFNEKFRRVMKLMLQHWAKNISSCGNSSSVLLQVSFNNKSGHSITRSSTSATNSLTMHSKGSLTHQELQPLKNGADKKKQENKFENGGQLLNHENLA